MSDTPTTTTTTTTTSTVDAKLAAMIEDIDQRVAESEKRLAQDRQRQADLLSQCPFLAEQEKEKQEKESIPQKLVCLASLRPWFRYYTWFDGVNFHDTASLLDARNKYPEKVFPKKAVALRRLLDIADGQLVPESELPLYTLEALQELGEFS